MLRSTICHFQTIPRIWVVFIVQAFVVHHFLIAMNQQPEGIQRPERLALLLVHSRCLSVIYNMCVHFAFNILRDDTTERVRSV